MKTDAEIAGKLDGMMCGGYGFWMTAGCLYFGEFRGNTIASQLVPQPANFLALCRAVVSKVDGERFTIPEILSATTARHRKEQG